VFWYCDGSALAKRYVRELGSQWFRQEVGKHSVIVAQVTIVEVRAAIALRMRTGSLSKFAGYKARQQYASHLSASLYLVLPLTGAIIDMASRLVFSHPLRAYDAVQLATALDHAKMGGVDRHHFCFLTADDRLERAANAEGLMTENPNRHS